MEQLAASLMNASMLMQVEKIRLAASCYPQACCKLFKQYTARNAQVAAGLLQT
jgi:hypothetical protein